jgi:hypothetical protein
MLIDAKDEGLTQKVYEFMHQGGREGFAALVVWASEQDDKVQQSFLDLLSGGQRSQLTAEMEAVAAKMTAEGMDPVAEATAAVAKKAEAVPVEEVISEP